MACPPNVKEAYTQVIDFLKSCKQVGGAVACPKGEKCGPDRLNKNKRFAYQGSKHDGLTGSRAIKGGSKR